VSRSALRLALVLAAIDVVLVNWAQPLFGRWWRHVMWEGGIVENLTMLQFLAGGIVFGLCALDRRRASTHRAWLALYALAELVLLGEETNYGTIKLFNFTDDYNPQAHNLHNYLIEAYIPVLGLGVVCAVLRAAYAPVVGRLRLPMSKDFLDAVLVTAIGLPFMLWSFRDDRFLSVDEVYEWSSSFLLLCLALYFRFGWAFRPRAGDEGQPLRSV
jgi:hypothetical protein